MSIWLLSSTRLEPLYVKPENLEVVVHNYFIAGGDRLTMMELEEILLRDEEPKPIQTVTLDNLLGFAMWMETQDERGETAGATGLALRSHVE